MYDRELKVSIAGSKDSVRWSTTKMLWSDLAVRLATSVPGVETQAAYLKMSKTEQDKLKDVGGFVGGELRNGRRRKLDVVSRDLATIDLDDIPSGRTQEVIDKVKGLGLAAVVYSTRKHRPEAPRLRVILPLDRSVTPDEYEPIVRRITEAIGIEYADPTTFETNRLMFWPSHSADAEVVYRVFDPDNAINCDTVLESYGMDNAWRNMMLWPQVPGKSTISTHYEAKAKQEDPTTKQGIIGAWCEVYDIYRVLDEIIPGVYEDTAHDGRYTFLGGSTAGGAIIYGDGKFLYSHHATDPASETLCNSWDLVRLHKFGHLDLDAKPGTPNNKLPSYQAMRELAASDSEVLSAYHRRAYATVEEDFADGYDGNSEYTNVSNDSTKDTKVYGGKDVLEIGEDGRVVQTTVSKVSAVSKVSNSVVAQDAWKKKLKLNPKTLLYDDVAENYAVILLNDVELRCLWYNKMSEKYDFRCPPGHPDELYIPWKQEDNQFTDASKGCLMIYLSEKYMLTSEAKMKYALGRLRHERPYSPVIDYLNNLPAWDGVPRIRTLLHKYLGAELNIYTEEVMEKTMLAAVIRQFSPKPVKFDTILVLNGPQGIGKSTFIKKLAVNWFVDTLTVTDMVDGKAAAEKLSEAFIAEIQELSGMRKADDNRVKQFASSDHDTYRPAYGQYVVSRPRRAILIGTTNAMSDGFLQDTTGNRRWNPVNCSTEVEMPVWYITGAERDMWWAEAMYIYSLLPTDSQGNLMLGVYDLTLSKEAEAIACGLRQSSIEQDDREGMVREYLDTRIPIGWDSWDTNRRRAWLNGDFRTKDSGSNDDAGNEATRDANTLEREDVTSMEIWVECFGREASLITPVDTRAIGKIMSRLDDWERKAIRRNGVVTKGYKRKKPKTPKSKS